MFAACLIVTGQTRLKYTAKESYTVKKHHCLTCRFVVDRLLLHSARGIPCVFVSPSKSKSRDKVSVGEPAEGSYRGNVSVRSTPRLVHLEQCRLSKRRGSVLLPPQLLSPRATRWLSRAHQPCCALPFLFKF